MLIGSPEKPPRLSEFELEIPEKLIAQFPAEKRDECKLMVLDRSDLSIKHRQFKDVVEYFRKGDVLAVNNTKVYPARLFARKDNNDSIVEVFLLRELQKDLWEAMVKPARKVRIGNKLHFGEDITCDVIDNTISGGRVVRFEYSLDSIYPFIEKEGLSPLPPYIKRDPVPDDKMNYQTVYALERGSVAAPTAGLHFTKELLDSIRAKGVKVVEVTLHIGLGTFRPIMVEDLTRHNMDSEYFHISYEAADTINAARKKKRSVMAVGTSTVRAMETVAVSRTQITAKKAWTDKFIFPPYDFKMVDKLVTNFHQPKSTLMMMVAAFGKKDFVLEAYQEAIRKKYRFYSYGDAMLII